MRHHTILCAAALALAAQFGTAKAEIDGQKLLSVINAQPMNTVTLVAAGVETHGTTVSIKGLTLIRNTNPTTPLELGDLELTDVTEKDGGYRIGKITIATSKITEKQGILEFGGAEIKDLALYPPGESSLHMFADSVAITINPTRFLTPEGKEGFSLGPATYVGTAANENQPALFEMKPFDMHFNFENLLTFENDKETASDLKALGLLDMNMKAAFKGSWSPTDGRIILSEETFEIPDSGKLKLALDVSGYTLAFVKEMDDVMKDDATLSQEERAKRGFQIVNLLQKVSLNSFDAKFEDSTLTGKAIDLFAKQHGVPREEIIKRAKTVVPLALERLKAPELAESLSSAVNAYLDNPKSIEIKAAPATALPIAQIVMMVPFAPALVIKQLGLDVIANQ